MGSPEPPTENGQTPHIVMPLKDKKGVVIFNPASVQYPFPGILLLGQTKQN